MDREYTGFLDRAGNKIYVGDVIEYYFTGPCSYSHEPIAGYTCMRDLVVSREGEYYAMCGLGGAYLWRCHKYCTVIGQNEALVDT